MEIKKITETPCASTMETEIPKKTCKFYHWKISNKEHSMRMPLYRQIMGENID